MSSSTFLFCVESGHFEVLTALVVESLRRFGGALAQSPVLAVTPRFGPPLQRETLRRFDALGIRYVRRHVSSPYKWYPYTNKALAALMAEEEATTEQVIWLDSDVLVVAEPTGLVLGDGEDFAICAFDKNVGSSGPDDRNEPYWRALAQHYGMSVDELPWIQTEFDRQRVRFRLHSGVYSFRRNRGLGHAFVADMAAMFSSRVLYSRRLPFPGDDVALAFSVVRRKLRWRLLPITYNFEIGPKSPSYRREGLKDSKILHYHHSFNSDAPTKWVLRELEAERPDVAEWIRGRVPMDARVGGLPYMLLRRALREVRALQSSRHVAASRPTIAE